jgi:hypothetical protein
LGTYSSVLNRKDAITRALIPTCEIPEWYLTGGTVLELQDDVEVWRILSLSEALGVRRMSPMLMLGDVGEAPFPSAQLGF